MPILLLTNTRDVTTDLVINEIKFRNLDFLRINSDYLAEALPTFRFQSHQPSLTLAYKGITVDASSITSAYLRRPLLDELAKGHEADVYYKFGEWRALLQSIYSELRGRWLNEPHCIEMAENKVRQLQIANSLGFLIPRTVVSNNPTEVAKFVARHPSIAKPLRSGSLGASTRPEIVFTTRLYSIDDIDFDSINVAPFIVQEEIPKSADIRVTVVGESIFATKIDSQEHEESTVDWRRGDVREMKYSIYHLPEYLKNSCVSLVKALGLRFGAIDLVLDRSQRHWFLEINPNGQWGWIQMKTGQPIAGAIVDELLAISAS